MENNYALDVSRKIILFLMYSRGHRINILRRTRPRMAQILVDSARDERYTREHRNREYNNKSYRHNGIILMVKHRRNFLTGSSDVASRIEHHGFLASLVHGRLVRRQRSVIMPRGLL